MSFFKIGEFFNILSNIHLLQVPTLIMEICRILAFLNNNNT